MDKKLTKSADKKWAGVCGGFAEYFGIDPTMMRAIVAVVALVTGILPMLIIYLVLSFILPDKQD